MFVKKMQQIWKILKETKGDRNPFSINLSAFFLDFPLQEADEIWNPLRDSLCRAKSIHPRKRKQKNNKKNIENGFQIVLSQTSKYKTHTMRILLLSRLKKDIEVKQCFEDPKACLKLAADDKGYVSFTWTHFSISTWQRLVSRQWQKPSTYCTSILFLEPDTAMLKLHLASCGVPSTRHVHRGFKAAWKSSLSLISLHHGHCYILVLYPCQKCDCCHPCYWKFWQNIDSRYLSVRIFRASDIWFFVR